MQSRERGYLRWRHIFLAICEAWFYAGMKNVLGDDKWAAAQFFKKCLATGQKNAVEYHFAKEELNALGQ